nr:MAG TPA: hypothetical protein [Bacteriophage sp.]
MFVCSCFLLSTQRPPPILSTATAIYGIVRK